MPSGIINGDDRYVDRITVNGRPYFEIGIRAPDGEGYLIERVSVEESSSRLEIEEAIEEAKRALEERKEELEGSEDWFDDWESVAREFSWER